VGAKQQLCAAPGLTSLGKHLSHDCESPRSTPLPFGMSPRHPPSNTVRSHGEINCMMDIGLVAQGINPRTTTCFLCTKANHCETSRAEPRPCVGQLSVSTRIPLVQYRTSRIRGDFSTTNPQPGCKAWSESCSLTVNPA